MFAFSWCKPIINDTPDLNRYGWIEVSFFSESIEITAFSAVLLNFLNELQKRHGGSFRQKGLCYFYGFVEPCKGVGGIVSD